MGNITRNTFRGIEINNTKTPERNGGWVYGNLVDKNRIGDLFSSFEVIPETISQCIGLEDCTGEMLFEGDIIEFTKGDIKSLHIPKKIVYEPTSASYILVDYVHGVNNQKNPKNIGLIMGLSELTISRYGYKKVGNIYEHEKV